MTLKDIKVGMTIYVINIIHGTIDKMLVMETEKDMFLNEEYIHIKTIPEGDTRGKLKTLLSIPITYSNKLNHNYNNYNNNNIYMLETHKALIINEDKPTAYNYIKNKYKRAYMAHIDENSRFTQNLRKALIKKYHMMLQKLKQL